MSRIGTGRSMSSVSARSDPPRAHPPRSEAACLRPRQSSSRRTCCSNEAPRSASSPRRSETELRRHRVKWELRISRFPPPDQNGAVRFIEARVKSKGSIILNDPHINQDAEPVASSPAARSRTRECRIKEHRPIAARLLNRSENLVRIASRRVDDARACMHVNSSVKPRGEG